MAWPDAVRLTIDYLVPVVAPVHVGSRVPDQRPTTFVQVRRVGGIPNTVRDRSRLDIFTWAPTDPEAMNLALTIRQAIWALSGTTLLGPAVYQIDEFMGLRQDDDELTGTPRVWATYEIHIRADDAIQPAPSIAS